MSLIPNPREHLALAAARVSDPRPGQNYSRDASGKVVPIVHVDLLDIIAFDIGDDGRPIPITVRGRPDPLSGDVYAVFDRRDQSYTTLDGTYLGKYKEFAALVEKRDADAALWARGEGLEASQHATGDGKGSDSPPPGSALIAGLANPRPASWR